MQAQEVCVYGMRAGDSGKEEEHWICWSTIVFGDIGCVLINEFKRWFPE
jgi:hypothetical protein